MLDKHLSMSELNKIYFPIIFADMKDVKKKGKSSIWSVQEQKMFCYIIAQMKPNIIFHKDMKETNFDIESDAFMSLFEDINRRFKISRKTLVDNIGFNDVKHFSRDLRNTLEKLSERVAKVSYPDNIEKYDMVPVFAFARYDPDMQLTTIELNKYFVPFVIYLVRYAKIDLTTIFKLRNDYSVTMYLYFKSLINPYKNIYSLKLTIDEFKDKIYLAEKYSEITSLRKKVIDVFIQDINEHTDINLDYELEKKGRKVQWIIFSFKKKASVIIDHEPNDDPIACNPNIDGDEITYPIEEESHENEKALLRTYGISVKAIEKYFEPLTGYQIEHIQQAIARLETEIARGKIIVNKPAYFATVLKSVVDDSQALLQAQAHEAEKQQRIEKSNKVKNAWDELDRYISENEGYVLLIIDSFVRSIPITADEVIAVRDKITELYMVEDIGKIQIPFNSLSRVETALGEKWSIGASNIMYFISEANCVNGGDSYKIKALKESLAFHTDIIETVEDEKLKAHHKENVEKIKNNLLILLGVDVV